MLLKLKHKQFKQKLSKYKMYLKEKSLTSNLKSPKGGLAKGIAKNPLNFLPVLVTINLPFNFPSLISTSGLEFEFTAFITKTNKTNDSNFIVANNKMF